VLSTPPSRAQGIFDGDLIRNPNAQGDTKYDIYIVKLVGTKKFKRLILSPHVFDSYGHLNWDKVLLTDQATMNQYTTSNLVRCSDPDMGINDPKVYQLMPSDDNGTKTWLNMTISEFSAQYDWDSIYTINQVDRDAYIDISDWATYQNAEYGFELKHPLGWKIEEHGPYTSNSFLLHNTLFTDWAMTIWETSVNNSQIINNTFMGLQFKEENNIYIGDKPAVELIYYGPSQALDGMHNYRLFIVHTDDFTYSIDSDLCLDDKNPECVQILSTVKFNKPTIDFVKTGNVINRDSSQYLVYEKPGAPAITIEFVFNEDSLCRSYGLADNPDISCVGIELNDGDEVGIEGKISNTQVIVKRLTGHF